MRGKACCDLFAPSDSLQCQILPVMLLRTTSSDQQFSCVYFVSIAVQFHLTASRLSLSTSMTVVFSSDSYEVYCGMQTVCAKCCRVLFCIVLFKLFWLCIYTSLLYFYITNSINVRVDFRKGYSVDILVIALCDLTRALLRAYTKISPVRISVHICKHASELVVCFNC
jgi:hypothetical protein